MSTVGEIKATRRMSLADCFAAALAKHERAEIYTGDPEFRCGKSDKSDRTGKISRIADGASAILPASRELW
jgi:hypothetical protein